MIIRDALAAFGALCNRAMPARVQPTINPAADHIPRCVLPPTAAGPQPALDFTESAIVTFDRFVQQYALPELRAHFADNDDNAAEYVRRGIRLAGRRR